MIKNTIDQEYSPESANVVAWQNTVMIYDYSFQTPALNIWKYSQLPPYF